MLRTVYISVLGSNDNNGGYNGKVYTEGNVYLFSRRIS